MKKTKTLKTMVSNRQKRKRLVMRTFAMLFFMALFTQFANAQVYMHNGSSYVGTSGVKFYDSGGPSSGPSNYWLHWFGRNQDFTYTFNPENTNDAIQVDFEAFTAYTDNNGTNDAHALAGTFAMRLNNAELSIYEGTAVASDKLITTLTGTIPNAFTVMSNGPITFHFKSYNFTEEGWGATVKSISSDDYGLQKPAISMEVCSDLVIINPTTLGATIRYTIDDSTPSASNGNVYNGPFAIESYPKTVRAVTVSGNNASAVADKTYNESDATPVPAVLQNSQIVRDGNTIIITPPTVPDHLNETYGIIYTYATGGGTPEDPVYYGYQDPNNVGTYLAPDGWNGSMPGLVHFEWTTPNTNFKFRVVAQTCVKQSPVKTYYFEKLQVPDPTLVITDNGDNTGNATITWEAGYTIRYTTDGSIPTGTSGDHPTVSGNQVTLTGLTPGTTVKVIAYKETTGGEVDPNYDLSNLVSGMYLPGGGNSGSYGGVVILNDLEDHSWSYYSDETSPIKSLNPADVKITYYGNGTGNMTNASESGNTPTSFSANATGVKVNVDANEDQFIYLKTLEKDESTSNYPYTMIPNPFQVRPKYVGGKGNRDGETVLISQGGSVTTNSATFYDSGGENGNYSSNEDYTITFRPSTSGSKLTVTFESFDVENSYDNLYVYDGTSTSATLLGTLTGTSLPAAITATNSSGALTFRFTSDGTVNRAGWKATITAPGGGGTASEWRGFYAWRVKRLSSGLTIKDKNSNDTFGLGDPIPAETEIEFVTSNSEGNEVDFEALWAQAYVTTSTNTNGLVSAVGYERNFMVLGSNPSSQTQTVTIGNNATTTTNGTDLPLTNYYYYSLTQQIYTPSEIGYEGRITSLAFRYSSNQNITRNIDIYLMHTTESTLNGTYGVSMTNSVKVYSGNFTFRSGWNTITFTTPFDYDGTSNLIVAVDDNTNTQGSNRYFYTYSTGTARARYWRSNSQNYDGTGGYNGGTTSNYNAQIQFTINTNANGNSLNGITVPCTVMACNPDGTNLSSSVMVSGNILCGADLKIENVKMNGSESSSLNGNGHSLIIGRGVTPGTSGLCSGNVYGYRLSSAPTSAINFKLRMESGVFNNVYGLYGSSTSLASATTNVGITFGSDYDRAIGGTTGNGKFEIAGTYSLTFSVINGTATSKYITNVFSGTYTCATDEFYMGYWNSDAMKSIRYNTIYGGDFANGLTLGIDQSANSNTTTGFLRIYGGNFQEQLYATGQYAQATGSRRIVITGGTFGDWIAAGCYGTNPSGGYLDGNVALYFGGKAKQTSDAGLFGSGYGSTEVYGTADENSYYVNASTVVVADQAQVAGSVYGGGNNGFAQNSSDVHILGGTISGNVFGGANKSKGATITVNVKGGTIAGNVYGGSDTKGVISNLATVNVSGGTVTDVFGGGLGEDTDMSKGTAVNISGGTINNNVYGGGEKGTVSDGGTQVNVSGGTMKDVYGAGKGESAATGSKATVTGQTFVNVTGGTIANVYGGGENGNVVASSGGGSSSGETLTYDFEDGTAPSGWTMNDWTVYNYSDYAHNGSCFLYSPYDENNAVNNALITNQFLLGGSISFYVRSVNATYYNDYITVLVSTDGTNYTAISETFKPTNNYTQYTYDLSTYAGRQGYVMIRHTSVADQAGIFIDDVTIVIPEQQQGDDATLASTVTINGGNISENVFGGGAYGTTDGNTVVNMKNGNVHGSVYGGALGDQGSVYVAGTHTVNVLGGRVYSNVYGGSRNANDALSFNPGTFDNATDDETVCVVNISGGQIDENVYAAGYFGNCFGSVYAFVGKDAIYNAPHHVETAGQESAGEAYTIAKLSIAGSVWAGGDWGTFNGTFGAPTISGNSNVYVDGQDYITNTTDKNTVGYMGIDGSVYGSGTSCDAGKKEHTVMLRNYGQSSEPYTTATRNFTSIQRVDYLVLDNTHLHFTGQGLVNSLNVTESYAIYEAEKAVIVTGGSTLIMDAPVNQIKSFWSASCSDVYTAALPTSQTETGGYTALTPTTLSNTPNKIRVNGGNYIKVYYDDQYGMLNGYAYMMSSSNDNEATCAYARPRWCTDAPFEMNDGVYDNRNDGGWVSYVSGDNVFDLAGNKVTTGGVQMEYENHTPSSKVGEDYFRIWRTTGQIHEREGVFDVVAYGNDEFKYVDVEIELPSWRGHDYYYMFQTISDHASTTIDYGTELEIHNAALYAANSWITYDVTAAAQKLEANTSEQDEIKARPEINYGLVIMSGTADALNSPQISGATAPALIINNDADGFLAQGTAGHPTNSFTNEDNTALPTVIFRLTYSDLLNSNKTYDPIWVNLVQCDKDGNVKDIVKVKLIINTSSVVGRDFKTQVYAVMNNQGSTAEQSHVQVVLPRFTLNQPGVDSHFTVESIDWTPATTIDGPGELVTVSSGSFDKTKFGMEFSASDNYDGTTGWNELNYTIYDTKTVLTTAPEEMGTTTARSQFSFDFNLYYNGQVSIDVDEPELMGTLVYHMKFTNYGTVTTQEPNGAATFTITIDVYRRGKGGRFYLDGVNGKNSYNGKRPDRAMLTLAALFNRSEYLPGDEIYVVNQVTAANSLEWNGLAKGGNVLIYRYNGGHQLEDPTTGIIDNENNTAYKGALIEVPANATMNMRGITLDGYYKNGGTKDDYSTVTAESPLITVKDGGKLELNQNVTLQQNYNINDGGAVYVYEGGTLMMNEDARITNNKTEYNGGGVYMNGTMIASDKVVIWDNKGDDDSQNNVYLASKASVLQIGEDADSEQYKDLAYVAGNADASAKIGLSKSTSSFTNGVAEVVYSNELSWLTEPLETQAIIVHDGNIYRLETGEDPNKLYWRDTWVTAVTSQPAGFAINNIDSEEDLAWLISLVNGENGQTAQTYAGQTVIIKSDLDMQAHTWVPIGEKTNVFKGTFEGNGYTIEGLNSSLNRTDLGMFGITEGATIQNVIAQGSFDGIANNYGTIAGTMKGGTLSNVEAAGVLTGDDTYAKNIGGLVGVAETNTIIHSSFAVNTITAQRDETVVGGLVGDNSSKLYNSYANVTINGTANTPIGGLAGVNKGHIENCYAVVGNQTFPAFAHTNSGSITLCYADKDNGYVNTTTGGTLSGHGNYSAALGRKAFGYMYDDNKVTLASGQTNSYVADALTYNAAGTQIEKWPGLLSTLNQWVKVNPGYTPWLRPTSENINSDLPVLTFSTGNALGTTDGKFLNYSVTSATDNGLDALIDFYGGKTSYIFLYDDATNVAKVPGARTYVFINEDAVLIQTDDAGDFINTTVGITFDNSALPKGNTWNDIEGEQPLKYDWHFLSSPLKKASLGITYEDEDQHNWWATGDDAQVQSVSGSYFPDGLESESIGWDIYTFLEPQYHWINLKRNSASHFHYDPNSQNVHENIVYTNETEFEPGKGYMMAIEQDSYLSNTGTLTNEGFTVDLSFASPDDKTEKGCNFIGNPYQAYFDLNEFFNENGMEYAWVYLAESNQYVPYLKGASDNPATPAGTLHPHQGFFVKVASTGKKAKFTKAMATADKTNAYYRGSQVNYPLVNLFAYNEAGQRDFVVVEFDRPDRGGAPKMTAYRNAPFNITAQDGQEEYTVLFTDEYTKRVPIRFTTVEDGTFTLKWETYHGTFHKLLLVDNITGATCDMSVNDHYTFEGHVTDYANRFYLVVATTDVDEFDADNNANFAYFNGSEWIVNGEGQLDLVDMTGRVLYSKHLTGETNSVSFGNVAAGVYVIRFGNKAQKIIIR